MIRAGLTNCLQQSQFILDDTMNKNSLFTSYEATQSWPKTIQAQPSENAPTPTGASSQTNNQNPARKRNPPSCIFCRQKKVKCDRADPCSRCVRVGTICISFPPSGLPRGRKGGRRKLGSKLLDRILNLENLVNDIEGKRSGETTAVPPPANGIRPVRYLNSFSC